jgi:UMF1 family MFS transporter
MYDAADSAFTTVIVTVLFAPYFSQVIVGDAGRADLLWGQAASISELLVALLAPILGAIADYSGSRKRFLALCAAIIVIFTASLWFVTPGAVMLGFWLYVIANIGFAGGGVFIDSFLPGIANESNAGRISGLKWTIGYLSGMLCLLICYPLAANNIVPNPTNSQLSQARLIPVVVAVYFLVMVIPTFIFLRDRTNGQKLPAGQNYLTIGFRRVRETIRHIRHYRELFKLLIAFLVYNDGVVTVIYFAALYATVTIGFTTGELTIMFFLLNIVAAGGAFGFGLLADRIGQKRTIFISLVFWIIAVVLAYFAQTKSEFYAVAVLAGLGLGSCQSVSRSLMALFTPRENAAEFFGFLGIAGKALAFLGPLIFGVISRTTGSQRPAILAIGLFFVVGMVLLSQVDEERGRAAARLSVDQLSQGAG